MRSGRAQAGQRQQPRPDLALLPAKGTQSPLLEVEPSGPPGQNQLGSVGNVVTEELAEANEDNTNTHTRSEGGGDGGDEEHTRSRSASASPIHMELPDNADGRAAAPPAGSGMPFPSRRRSMSVSPTQSPVIRSSPKGDDALFQLVPAPPTAAETAPQKQARVAKGLFDDLVYDLPLPHAFLTLEDPDSW